MPDFSVEPSRYCRLFCAKNGVLIPFLALRGIKMLCRSCLIGPRVGNYDFHDPGLGVTPKEVAPDGSPGFGYRGRLRAGCKGRA